MRGKFIGIAAALMSAVCWGGATVMSKGALEGFHPVLLLNVQLVGSLIFIWSAILIFRLDATRKKTWFGVSMLGLLEPGLAYFLGLIGLTYVEASAATLIQSTEGLMIALLAFVLFKEKLSYKFWLLSALALLGLSFVIGTLSSSANVGGVQGQALIVAGTLAAAVYVVLSGRISNSMNPVVMVAYQQIVALVLAFGILLFYVAQDFAVLVVPSSLKLWSIAIVSGIVQYAVAFSLYFYAMRSMSTASAGAFLNLVPVFGIIGAFVFLGERLSVLQFVGAGVTLICVTLISVFYSHQEELSEDGDISNLKSSGI